MELISNLENPENAFSAFLRRCGLLLLHPREFFKNEYPSLSFGEAVSLGLVSTWVSTIFNFFTGSLQSILIATLLESWLQNLFPEDAFPGALFDSMDLDSYLWQVGFVILCPLLILFRESIASVITFSMTKLLVRNSPIVYRDVYQLRCTCLGSSWISLIPLVGGFLSTLVFWFFLITGIQEKYKTSTSRALAIVLGPLLVSLFLLMFFAFIVLVFLSVFTFQEVMGVLEGA